ncbi:hypothetical protein D3C74_390060 [compost metagenome]
MKVYQTECRQFCQLQFDQRSQMPRRQDLSRLIVVAKCLYRQQSYYTQLLVFREQGFHLPLSHL